MLPSKNFAFLGKLLTFIYLVSLTGARAQAQTGTPPFGSFAGGPDVIDLANLNVHLDVPMIHKGGRGGLNFNYNMSYDTSVWFPTTSGSTTTWSPVLNWGWRSATEAVVGYLSYLEIPICSTSVFLDWAYHDTQGVVHPFNLRVGNPAPDCPRSPPPSATATTTDGSGYMLTAFATSTGVSASLTSRSGDIIQAPFIGSTISPSVTDSNGNEITVNSSGVFTDTLGSVALTVAGAGTPSSPMTFTYTAASGMNAAFTMSFKTYSVKTNFGCNGITEYAATSKSLVDRITLPDNSFYQFTYEATPGSSGTVTGRLVSVTLPTGATISYTYTGTNNGILCGDGSAAGLTRTTPDGTWSYARSIGSSAASTTTVTDPQGNQTVIQFQGIYETQRQVYQGASATGTLLETVYTCYNGVAYPCNSAAITLPITQIAKTNSWASSQISQTVTSYNSFGLPTEVDEFGYGASSPGSLVRKTVTSYASLGNSINDRPASVAVYAAGASNPSSQTTYTYDQSSVTTTTGTPQHVAVSGSRGNATTTTHSTQGASTISTTSVYFDTGTVQTATDSNGNQTTYDYGSSSCGNSFVTTINRPLSLSQSQTWNCNGGLIASRTDENGRVTSYSYDLLNRPTLTHLPDGGWTLVNYTSANQRDTYTGIADNTPSTSCTGCSHTQLNLDSLGRESSTILVSDPEGETTTTTTYDTLGRILKKSNPYRSTSDSTYGLEVFAYDPLNRITSITHADNNIVNSYYGSAVSSHGGAVSQSCSPATYGLGFPILRVDETSKKQQVWADALGMTIEADEPDSTGSLTLSTCHLYDALGNSTQIVQGTQTRTYAYDMLSRKTSETTPEAGTVNFYYTTSSGSLCSGNPLYVCRQTDNRGITTTSSYDAINRLTSKSYSDSTPSKTFYYDESTVTVAGTAHVLSNSKGRLSHTSAAAGTALTIHSYDSMGRASDFWQCTPFNCSSASIWKTHYTYDLAGDLTSWQHPNGETITQTISNARRITQITSSLNDATHPGTLAQSIKYAPHGALTQLQNGCVGTGCTQRQETYDYNNRLQAVRIQLGTPTNQNANSCQVYNYYGVANPTSCSIPAQASSGNDRNVMGHFLQDTTNPTQGHTATYTYDNVNRLTTSVATGSSVHNVTFSYDRFGNMTCVTNGQTNGPCPNYTFNTSTNRVTNNGYTYDAAGNLTEDGTGTLAHTYQWDAENRLKSIDNGSTASYTYNALGQRVEKLVGTTYTEYAYHSFGEDLGEHNRSIWSVRVIPFGGRHLAHYQGAANATYFMHDNRVGSTSQVTDYTGTMVQDQLYYPWGQEWNIVGTAQEMRFARLNHRDQTESDLDPTLFRMYSSTQGRWLGTDPLQARSTNPQLHNRYTYVRNLPTSRLDPIGAQECDPEFGCGGCEPYFDIFCEPFFGEIIISFFCPNNKASCCPYYTNLIINGPTSIDRQYGAVAFAVCQFVSGVSCTQNCIRQCLVNFNMQNCDNLPDANSRLFCREVLGHAFCVPKGIAVGAALDRTYVIVVPAPIFLDIRVAVPFTCNLAK